jgi:hypothetical protein
MNVLVYFIWGALSFPSSTALRAWETRAADPGEYSDWNVHFEGELPPIVRSVDEILSSFEEPVIAHGGVCYFLAIDPDLTRVTLRGLLDRNDLTRELLAAFRCASEEGAVGDIYFQEALSGAEYRVRSGENTSSFASLGNDHAGGEVTSEILLESRRRAETERG